MKLYKSIENLISIIVNRFVGLNHNLQFLIFIISILMIFEVPSYINSHPISTHYWRQSDCVSLSINYYNNGMKFFQPEIHNQVAGDGISGKAVSEFTILYYLNAALYFVFGVHPFVYRTVYLVLFVWGLWFLFKLAKLVVNNAYYAFIITFLIFTTPVIFFYSISPLPDNIALGASFAGWYYFFRYIEQAKSKLLILSLLMFTFASLLKITASANLLIIGFISMLEFSGLLNFKKHEPIFHKPIKTILYFALCVTIIVTWYFYAIKYNQYHQSTYFSTKIWPIWMFSKIELIDAWSFFKNEVIAMSFSSTLLFFFAALLLFPLYNIKYASKLLGIVLIMLLIGFIMFFILWFYGIKNHDYYLIYWTLLIVFSFFISLKLLKNIVPKIFNSKVFKGILLIIFFINAAYGKNDLKNRMEKNNYGIEYKSWYNADGWLESIGVMRGDKVISLPDETPNYTLSLINRKGWTQFYNKNLDSVSFQQSIIMGAEWLLIKEETLNERPWINTFINKEVGRRGDMLVFSIK